MQEQSEVKTCECGELIVLIDNVWRRVGREMKTPYCRANGTGLHHPVPEVAAAECRRLEPKPRTTVLPSGGAALPDAIAQPKPDAAGEARPATTSDELLFRLRAHGWVVAVHNDYRINGTAMTFWLFTHADGRYIKGEGRSDVEAISQAYVVLSAPRNSALEEAAKEMAEAASPFIQTTNDIYVSDKQRDALDAALARFRALGGE